MRDAGYVGNISVPTVDEQIRRVFEPYALAIARWIEWTRRLPEADIRTARAWCPFLPGVENSPEQVRSYVRTAAQAAVRKIRMSGVNYGSFVYEAGATTRAAPI